MDFADLIPVASILAAVAFAWIAYKNRELRVLSRDATNDAAHESAEKKRLEARLAVLERIVTDRGIDTADQIEALREPSHETATILQRD